MEAPFFMNEQNQNSKMTDDPDWWNKALEQGKRKNAFENALYESFEHLNEKEQEEIFFGS